MNLNSKNGFNCRNRIDCLNIIASKEEKQIVDYPAQILNGAGFLVSVTDEAAFFEYSQGEGNDCVGFVFKSITAFVFENRKIFTKDVTISDSCKNCKMYTCRSYDSSDWERREKTTYREYIGHQKPFYEDIEENEYLKNLFSFSSKG